MNFFKGLIDDSVKEVNPAHVIAFALTGAVIVWVSYIVFKTKTLPDLSSAAYLLGGAGAVNVAHKMQDIIDRFKKSPADDVSVEPASTTQIKKKDL